MTASHIHVTFEYMLHMLSCYRTLKLLKKRYFCTYAPRLDISLKKIPRPSNLHTTYLSRYSMRWYSQTKYFPNGSIFFEFTNFCKLEKILPVGTRLNISLIKTTTIFKCAHDLPVAVFYTMAFANKYFPNGSIFFPIYKLL